MLYIYLSFYYRLLSSFDSLVFWWSYVGFVGCLGTCVCITVYHCILSWANLVLLVIDMCIFSSHLGNKWLGAFFNPRKDECALVMLRLDGINKVFLIIEIKKKNTCISLPSYLLMIYLIEFYSTYALSSTFE